MNGTHEKQTHTSGKSPLRFLGSEFHLNWQRTGRTFIQKQATEKRSPLVGFAAVHAVFEHDLKSL